MRETWLPERRARGLRARRAQAYEQHVALSQDGSESNGAPTDEHDPDVIGPMLSLADTLSTPDVVTHLLLSRTEK
jgi:hypothetical protein